MPHMSDHAEHAKILNCACPLFSKYGGEYKHSEVYAVFLSEESSYQ